MRASPIIEKAFRAASEQWPSQLENRVDRLQDEFGIDMQNGLHSITAFGKELGERTGVLVAKVEVNKDLLEGKIKEASGYESSEHNGHTLHTWTGRRHPTTVVFYKPGVLVVGRKTADLTAALDVLDGKAASLGKGTAVTKKGGQGRRVTVSTGVSPLAAAIPADAMFVGCASNMLN